MRAILIRIAVLSMALILCISSEALGHNSNIVWHKTGASEFGQCGDSGPIGYRGDYLPTRWKSFAELDNGGALGGLAYNTKIRVLSPVTHRRLTIRKRDIGGGGGSVGGYPRTIDLYKPVAQYLVGAECSWTGVILWRFLK